MQLSKLLNIEQEVKLALSEDLADKIDYTATLIPKDKISHAYIKANQELILCGMPWVIETIKQFDTSIELVNKFTDGDKILANEIICELKGPARSLLTIERTILNFLQTLSGVATTTNSYVAIANQPDLAIMDTRKTIPGLRYALKYAVQIGGGVNQRIGLFDGVLIKENHIIANGGISKTLALAFEIIPHDIPIQIEVENIAELEEALNSGAKLILLDNMTLEQITEAVRINQEQYQKQAKLEISGNVNLTSLPVYATTGVDRISIGALTKNINAIDLSMRFYH